MTLKDKTISGLLWSFIDNFSRQGITFVVGIILARMLTPREFGLIGMTTIFIAISQSFVDSGFSQALIRKKNCTQTDYSTVFYFNLVMAMLVYAILYFSSGAISRFFDEPQLKMIIQVLGLGLIVNAFTIIQRTRLTKRIDFKLQTKISVIAVIGSGTLGIIMAYHGYGVWSLVTKTLAGFALTSLFLWIWNGWMPSLVFSKKSFREMFSFGSRLLASGLINTGYQNIYLLVIGKYFSAEELGFYARADQFKNLPSQNITSVIQRVSYPVLSSIQDDIPRLKAAYQKLIKSTMLITFVAMMGLAAIAEPLVITLIGEQWLPSVIYLQLLSFVGMLYPLHAINLNMLNVQGRSDLFLRLEIIKKLMAIPVIIIGITLGIKFMILGMIVNSMIAYFLNSYYSGRFLSYSSLEQIKDILPSFLLAVAIGISIFTIGYFLQTSMTVKLLIQIGAWALLTFLLVELFNMKDYKYIKQIVQEKF
jgi:teichuronic acid exporter